MSSIVVRGAPRNYTSKKTGEIQVFNNFTVIDLDDGNVMSVGQVDVPPGCLPGKNENIFYCEVVMGVRQFSTKEGRGERAYIKEFRNAKPISFK
jgi:hypothetical protein